MYKRLLRILSHHNTVQAGQVILSNCHFTQWLSWVSPPQKARKRVCSLPNLIVNISIIKLTWRIFTSILYELSLSRKSRSSEDDAGAGGGGAVGGGGGGGGDDE